jgi:hypothetical protein
MPRQITGDPLTGSLPRTQLIVPQDVLGPIRTKRVSIRDEWPNVADPLGITMKQLQPGRVAAVQTRLGPRKWVVRTVNTSRQGRNKGRHFFTGMDQSGRCHSAWVHQVISVESVQQALSAAKVLKAIGPG